VVVRWEEIPRPLTAAPLGAAEAVAAVVVRSVALARPERLTVRSEFQAVAAARTAVRCWAVLAVRVPSDASPAAPVVAVVARRGGHQAGQESAADLEASSAAEPPTVVAARRQALTPQR
jgi:hypothetical protein